MQGSISLRVNVPSVQKLTAIREHLSAECEDDEAVTVIAASSALEDQVFTVIGTIRGKPDETWTAEVHAQSAQQAKDKALAADKRRAVTAVLMATLSPGVVVI